MADADNLGPSGHFGRDVAVFWKGLRLTASVSGTRTGRRISRWRCVFRSCFLRLALRSVSEFRFAAAVQRCWRRGVVGAFRQWRQGEAHSRQVDVDQIASEYVGADQTIFVADGVLVADKDDAVLERQLANVNAVRQGQVAGLQPFVAESAIVGGRN